mmetsp:Transcript_11171/g.30420  ORF Transcript_11171/g.30420 Transcript_11171/m.30420 type:complete len:256 (+) Transcript_11171:173-940(+)
MRSFFCMLFLSLTAVVFQSAQMSLLLGSISSPSSTPVLFASSIAGRRPRTSCVSANKCVACFRFMRASARLRPFTSSSFCTCFSFSASMRCWKIEALLSSTTFCCSWNSSSSLMLFWDISAYFSSASCFRFCWAFSNSSQEFSGVLGTSASLIQASPSPMASVACHSSFSFCSSLCLSRIAICSITFISFSSCFSRSRRSFSNLALFFSASVSDNCFPLTLRNISGSVLAFSSSSLILSSSCFFLSSSACSFRRA